jgi:hypothetical protein
MELSYDPALPPMGIYPKECMAEYTPYTCTLMLTAALFTTA